MFWFGRLVSLCAQRAAPVLSSALRDRIAILVAFLTIIGIGAATSMMPTSTRLLMPGPLTSAHASLQSCSACHANSGFGKWTWLRGLIGGKPHGDSKACAGCHSIGEHAFNAHGARLDVLKRSTRHAEKRAATIAMAIPKSAMLQSMAFPASQMSARGIECATCHQEHQGAQFELTAMSDEQCRSCHTIKFDSFDRDHPAFDGYPFTRRTRIIYDHASHFSKHFPEVAKKSPTKNIPQTCANCHVTGADAGKSFMGVATFEQACAACHANQINGNERAIGPKGIAFLTVPGLDVQTLKSRNANIGEWPEDSEAALSPFMKVMLSRTKRGRALLTAVAGLNLQDLSRANAAQMTAVSNFVWEIKSLFNDMLSNGAGSALRGLKDANGVLSADAVADLTAHLPHDAILAAQREWLPSLALEMSRRKVTSDDADGVWEEMREAANIETRAEPSAQSRAEAEEKTDEETVPEPAGASAAEKKRAQSTSVKRDPRPCQVRLFGQCLLHNEQNHKVDAAEAGRRPTPDSAFSDGQRVPQPAKSPQAMRVGLGDVAAPQKKSAVKIADKDTSEADELLFPTADELREIEALTKGKSPLRAAPAPGVLASPATAPAGSTDAADAAARAGSDGDAESWAASGGWYRQDYAILYRPAGHKDKFMAAWLRLTARQSASDDASNAVFAALTHKDAQGACSKCHSIDTGANTGRSVNFSPAKAADAAGRFTRFSHEPHMAVMPNSGITDKGCLGCHALQKDSPYLKSFEQGNPASFASNFTPVKAEICRSCHTEGKARQDCQLCHSYHVDQIGTPEAATKTLLLGGD